MLFGVWRMFGPVVIGHPGSRAILLDVAVACARVSSRSTTAGSCRISGKRTSR